MSYLAMLKQFLRQSEKRPTPATGAVAREHVKPLEPVAAETTSLSFAPDIVSAPHYPSALTPGAIVHWDSPLFGLLQGELLTIRDDGRIEVYHPLTETVTPIPLEWIRR